MKKVLVLLFALSNLVYAQTGTSPNLVNQTNLTSVVTTSSTGGGYSGGSTPGYNPNTNTIMFGYTQSTIAYTYAFSQALQNSGMTITGYNYSWEYLNQDMSAGNLSAKLNFAGAGGTSLYNRSWTLGPTTNWTNVSGTEAFQNNGFSAANIANFSLSFNGKDARYWAGYYGPQVRNPSVTLNYTFDTCSSDPLSSLSCPGYAQAYLNQQCMANPLYNTSCPGYAIAYQTQQCSVNPLYDQSCAGYAAAYLTQQCNANPLYSTSCNGYEAAYFNQQCSENALYNSRCPGYSRSYHDQQCSINALYATDCTGYAQAFKSQQCNLNGLHDKTCPNYAETYAKKMLLEQQGMAKTVAQAGTIAQNAPTTDSSVTVSTGDATVDKVIGTPSTTSTSAPVQLVQANPGSTGALSVTTTSVSSPTVAAPPAPETKPTAPTARQELQERRVAQAKAKAVDEGKTMASRMGKVQDMESQKQIQNVVIQAMGFTPGFDAYNKAFIQDSQGYRPFSIYIKQVNVDNNILGRRMYGPSDNLHKLMIEAQWEIK